jgi:hypothetical protein
MEETKQAKRIAVTLPDDEREFLEQEAKETGVPLSDLMSYIAVNYVREEKRREKLGDFVGDSAFPFKIGDGLTARIETQLLSLN